MFRILTKQPLQMEARQMKLKSIIVLMGILIGITFFAPQHSYAWGYVWRDLTEENDQTIDGIPSQEIDKKVSQMVDNLTLAPRHLQDALPKNWQQLLKNMISGLIPRQYQYYGEDPDPQARDKIVYLVWYCLSPQSNADLTDKEKALVKRVIIRILKSDYLSSLAWPMIRPIFIQGYQMLPDQEQTYVKEYIAQAKKIVFRTDFYTKESRNWFNCLNTHTNRYDYYYSILSEEEEKKYIGTAAYKFIYWNADGEARGDFAKLEIWIFRRIHYDGIYPYKLRKWVLRLETAINNA